MCKFIALVALLLEIEEGFCGAFEFVEKSVLVLFVVPNILLKILGMFILPMLQWSARLFLLICLASLENLLPVLVYDFKLRNICFRVVVNGAVLKYCTSS